MDISKDLTPSEVAVYDESRAPALWGTLIALLVLNNGFIFSRCWINYRLHWKSKGRMFAEDFFMILSGVCVNTVIGNLLAATHHGLGLHTWKVNAEDPQAPQRLSNTFKYVWASMILTGPTFTSIKLALLFFYRRLFLFKQPVMKALWWTNLIYVLLWLIGSTGFYVFQCWPPDWYYLQYCPKFNTTAPGDVIGQCEATSVLHVALPLIFGLMSDVALLLLPILVISRLNMPSKRKAAVVGIFCVGSVACALELARIVQLLTDTDDETDASYGVAVFLILSAAEEVTAVACASLPIVGPALWKSIRGSKLATSSDAYRYRYRYRPRTTNGGPKRGFYRLDGSAEADKATPTWPQRPEEAHLADDYGEDVDMAVPLTTIGRGGSGDHRSVGHGQIVITTDIAVEIEERDETYEERKGEHVQ